MLSNFHVPPFRNRKKWAFTQNRYRQISGEHNSSTLSFSIFFLKMTYLCSCSWQVRKYCFVEKKMENKGDFFSLVRRQKNCCIFYVEALALCRIWCLITLSNLCIGSAFFKEKTYELFWKTCSSIWFLVSTLKYLIVKKKHLDEKSV